MEQKSTFGIIAFEFDERLLPNQVLKSAAGYYIGTVDESGFPFSRESQEYYKEYKDAEFALLHTTFTQRENP